MSLFSNTEPDMNEMFFPDIAGMKNADPTILKSGHYDDGLVFNAVESFGGPEIAANNKQKQFPGDRQPPPQHVAVLQNEFVSKPLKGLYDMSMLSRSPSTRTVPS